MDITSHIPTKRIKSRNSPPWINGSSIHEIRKKEAVQRKLRTCPPDVLLNLKSYESKLRKWSEKVVKIFITLLMSTLKPVQSDFDRSLS